MSGGPQLRELKLTVEENNQLHIILACAQGVNNSEVAKRCRVMRQTVGKWRSRFLERRLDGLPL